MPHSPAGWPASNDDVRVLAPTAIDAFNLIFASIPYAADPQLLELIHQRVAILLAVTDSPFKPLADVPAGKSKQLADWPTSDEFTELDRTCLTFAEQFVMDVAGMTVEIRTALTDTMTAAAFGVVQGLYALDQGVRLRVAAAQLFGVDPFDSDGSAGQIYNALNEMMTVVPQLTAVDPLTAELVRLRGARLHSCRLCSSRRRVSAAEQNAAALEDTNPLERDDLTDGQRAAIALTDAVILRPAALGEDVIAAVHSSLSPAETLEILLLIAHNAANKIAVALGGDAPKVSEGVEYFDIVNGAQQYGLPAPA